MSEENITRNLYIYSSNEVDDKFEEVSSAIENIDRKN